MSRVNAQDISVIDNGPLCYLGMPFYRNTGNEIAGDIRIRESPLQWNILL